MTIPEFSAHNIRLDDGTLTRPGGAQPMGEHPWFVAAMRVLDTVYGSDKQGLRIADLGCLEGGYAVEFARRGFESVGLEVRDNNFAACTYVKSKVDLPNLSFVQDDAWNIGNHGTFDAMFCAGLLYHIDDPKRFLRTLSACTTKVLIIHTHFAVETGLTDRARDVWAKVRRKPRDGQFDLGPMTTHEGLRGRWYTEFTDSEAFQRRDQRRWASWENFRSFWIQREWLLDALNQVGFDLVLEQFDSLSPNIAQEMTTGYYANQNRGMFIGIKTGGSDS